MLAFEEGAKVELWSENQHEQAMTHLNLFAHFTF